MGNLILLVSDDWPLCIRLTSRVCRIGSGADKCDIVLLDSSLDRLHATVKLLPDGTVHVFDFRTRSGTFVDGHRTAQAIVTCGAEIRFGNRRFTVRSAATLKELSVLERRGANSKRLRRLIATLTCSESLILQGLLEGRSEKQLAATRHVSRHTVHTHVKHIYSKLSVQSRAELCSLFLESRSSFRLTAFAEAEDSKGSQPPKRR